MSATELSSQIRNALLTLLARREHSQYELQQKLLQRFPGAADLIGEVLDGAADDGYQSDSRFAEAYIRARSNKGYGFQRLRQELRLRGVADYLIAAAISERKNDDQHFEQLVLVWRKKFKTAPADLKEKLRQAHFLRYRGFSSTDVEALFAYLQRENQ
ncbi:MAG: recombination regulator RecX [Cellvibrionaceae bacterium]|nr:recombination regulator RecX [Cellvibrionaceae bacterium]